MSYSQMPEWMQEEQAAHDTVIIVASLVVSELTNLGEPGKPKPYLEAAFRILNRKQELEEAMCGIMVSVPDAAVIEGFDLDDPTHRGIVWGADWIQTGYEEGYLD